MFLASQNKFRDQEMQRAVAGQDLQLGPGYAALYSEWAEQNKAVLYQWGPEDRTKRFTDFVRERTDATIHQLVLDKKLDESEERELLAEAHRGDLLLVSKDNGVHFDQILTPEEAAKAGVNDYQVLSPVLPYSADTTLNFSEVRLGQNLIHAVANFEGQKNDAGLPIWTVQDAGIENGKIHLVLLHNQFGTYELNLDPENPLAPADYTKKPHEVPDTQLPEEYREAAQDEHYNLAPDLVLKASIEAQDEEDDDRARKQMAEAGLSTWAALEALDHMSAEQRAQDAAAFMKAQMEKPLAQQNGPVQVPNVMAQKAAMNARFARQNKKLEDSRKHEKDLRAQAKKEQEAKDLKTRAAVIARRKTLSKSQKNILTGTGLAAGAVGGFLAALGTGSIFVSHIALFT